MFRIFINKRFNGNASVSRIISNKEWAGVEETCTTDIKKTTGTMNKSFLAETKRKAAENVVKFAVESILNLQDIHTDSKAAFTQAALNLLHLAIACAYDRLKSHVSHSNGAVKV